MTETIPFNKLPQENNDMFEMVIIAARRARQINALRTAKFPLPAMSEDQEEVFEESPLEVPVEPDWGEFPKPTTLAIQEFIAGKVNYRYTTKPVAAAPKVEDVDSEISE